MSVAILLACCVSALALDPSLDVSQYAHTAWKIRDGFTKGTINCIAQTPDGYLWLGTEFGLLRFDGVQAVPWRPPAGEQLPSDHISGLLVARDGVLWIGTFKGLASWKDGQLTIYSAMDGQYVGTPLEDRDGTVWAGSINPPFPGRLCAIRGGNVRCSGEDGSLGLGILGLYEDSKGNLWVGGLKGFWRWKPGSSEFYSVPDEPNGVRAFAESDDGTLLIGTREGVKRLVNGRVEAYSAAAPARQSYGQAILRDRDGGLWIATLDRGLVHIHNGQADTFAQADGLSGDFVLRLFEDREGNVWAATLNGLDRFRGYAIPTISIRQGLSHADAYSVLAARDASVWVGTQGGLDVWKHGEISAFGRRKGTQKPDGKLNGLPPNSLFQDSGGRIWVSTRQDFGYLQNDRFVPVHDYPVGYVHSIAELGPGSLWLANQQAGLLHISQGSVVQQIPWAGLGHKDHANALVADPAQRGLWLGFFRGGVAYFEDRAIRASYSAANGLGDGPVVGFRWGPRGALWVATEGGLSRIKDGHIATLTSKNGLPCDAIHWTMEDDDHAMWVYMPCGLVRIERPEVDAWIADPKRVVKTTTFDNSDGVRTHSWAGGYVPLVSKTTEGNLWFTTFDGVSIIDPHHLPFNKLPPPVHVEQIVADRKSYDTASDANGNLRLPPLVRDLEIDYTALSLVAPEKVRFRYKLEGRDRDWQDVGNRRRAFYTDLPPRHYRFRVIACNNSGVWNEAGASLEFSIAPAYYQTNWFRALCVLTFLGMFWIIYQRRVHTLKQRQALLERHQAVLEQHQTEIRALNEQMVKAQEAERMRIAGDLHDGVLQQITSLTLRLGSVKRQVPADSEAKTTVNRLQQELIQIGTDIRHISHELHPALLHEAGLPAALYSYCEEFSKVRGLPVECETDDSVKELSPGAALCLYRIAQEALGNAAKYSQAKKVEVRLSRSNAQVALSVVDDGVGCAPDQIGKSGGLGVINMRERVLQLNGTFEFDSQPGRGTRVTVTVPFRPAS